jgi:hypothetical protein
MELNGWSDPSREVRTGACLVRVEKSGPTGLFMTVTTSADIRESQRSSRRYVYIDEAVGAVKRFLEEFS